MRRIACRAWLVVFVLVWSGSLLAEQPAFEGKTLLFGNLHAHSSLSDDVPDNEDLSPENAFKYAHQHGLDFLAITDHHKGITEAHPMSISPAEYKEQLYEVARAYNSRHPGQFIAIVGIEWGTTATGNHTNVFGASELPPNGLRDEHYREFHKWAARRAAFGQFNHPGSWKGAKDRNRQVGNFGEDLYPSTQSFVAGVEPFVKSVAVITGVPRQYARSDRDVHRDMKLESYYKQFLNLGLHVSPSADQDTHWKNWGTATAARTAVWADRVTYEDFVQAVRANRVYGLVSQLPVQF